MAQYKEGGTNGSPCPRWCRDQLEVREPGRGPVLEPVASVTGHRLQGIFLAIRGAEAAGIAMTELGRERTEGVGEPVDGADQ